jgi:hypothetical protein
MRGEMSIVGPRPERVGYVDRLTPVIYRYAERHRVKPGMTGWAQVNGFRGRTSLADRIEWDNHYVENWSWDLDLAILARTVGSVLRGPSDGLSDDALVARPRSPVLRGRRLVHRLLGLFVLCFALLAFAPAAFGATAGQGSAPSAADQYIEQIPNATGSQPADTSGGGGGDRNGGGGAAGGGSSGGGGSGGGSGAGSALPLTSAGRAALRGQPSGGVADSLRQIATNPELGAPVKSLPASKAADDEPGLPSAALHALSPDDGGSQVLWLAIAMAATAAVAVAAALDGRRRSRRTGV